MSRILLLASLFLISQSLALQASASSELFKSPARQEMFKINSQKAIKAKVKDPDSAKFQGVFFNRAFVDGSPVPMVCGQVNAKNGLGGYGGFQRFVASGSAMAFLEEEVEDFNELWKTLCQ